MELIKYELEKSTNSRMAADTPATVKKVRRICRSTRVRDTTNRTTTLPLPGSVTNRE